MSDAAELFQMASEKFIGIGRLVQHAETMGSFDEPIVLTARAFDDLADIEEHAYYVLSDHV